MPKIEKKNIAVGLQLKSIELLKEAISLPAVPDISFNDFNFNIGLEIKADAINKILFVIVSIDIRNEDLSHILGSLVISCIYNVADFDNVVKIESDGKLNLPNGLDEILHSISISTARGVLFSTLRGTFLHNAFLPIVDPRSLQPL